jgi:hypothetical protein
MIARRFPDVVLCTRRSHAQAGRSGHLGRPAGSTRDHPDVQRLVLEAMEPEREHRRPTEEERVNKGDNVTFTGRGNSALYTLKRLKRDRPDLFQQAPQNRCGTGTSEALPVFFGGLAG